MAVDITENLYGLDSPGSKRAESLFDLFTAEVATSDGDWQDARGWEQILLEITIATTATVSIVGSNAKTEPANSAHGYVVATAVTATGRTEIATAAIPRWFKVYISSWTSGAVDVDMKVVRRIMDLMT
jgi:hypothetical protein